MFWESHSYLNVKGDLTGDLQVIILSTQSISSIILFIELDYIAEVVTSELTSVWDGTGM